MSKIKNTSNYLTDHLQVNAHDPVSGMFATVDAGMARMLIRMWRLGLKTQYSCEEVQIGDGLAYVVMNQSSARQFEKMLRKAKLSPESRLVADMFLKGSRLRDICVSRKRKDYFRVVFRKRFGDVPLPNNGFVVERLYQNAPHWLRTTYRWYPHWTPQIEKLLGELIQQEY